jgi:hypothetical protein
MNVTDAQEALDAARAHRIDVEKRADSDTMIVGVDLVSAKADETLAESRLARARSAAEAWAEIERKNALKELRVQHAGAVQAAQSEVFDRCQDAGEALGKLIDAVLAFREADRAAGYVFPNSFLGVGGPHLIQGNGDELLAEVVARMLQTRGLEPGPFMAICGQLDIMDLGPGGVIPTGGRKTVDVSRTGQLAAALEKNKT